MRTIISGFRSCKCERLYQGFAPANVRTNVIKIEAGLSPALVFGGNMKISFYYVDTDYINYLKDIEINDRGFTTVPNVEYTKKHKFVYGVVLSINDVNYYVPISSYKKQQEDNLLIKIENHKKMTVAGSMRFNYMIPVPKACLTAVDFSSSDFTEQEKVMLRKEYKACLKMLSQIQKRAKKTYDRVLSGRNEELIKNSCRFELLEKACRDYIS